MSGRRDAPTLENLFTSLDPLVKQVSTAASAT